MSRDLRCVGVEVLTFKVLGEPSTVSCLLQVCHCRRISRFVERSVTDFKHRAYASIIQIAQSSETFISESPLLRPNRVLLAGTRSVYAVADVGCHVGGSFPETLEPRARLFDGRKVRRSGLGEQGSDCIQRGFNKLLPHALRDGKQSVAARVSGYQRAEVAKHIVHQQSNEFILIGRRQAICDYAHGLCLVDKPLPSVNTRFLRFLHEVVGLLNILVRPDKIPFPLQFFELLWVLFLPILDCSVDFSLPLYDDALGRAAVFGKGLDELTCFSAFLLDHLCPFVYVVVIAGLSCLFQLTRKDAHSSVVILAAEVGLVGKVFNLPFIVRIEAVLRVLKALPLGNHIIQRVALFVEYFKRLLFRFVENLAVSECVA